GTRQVVQHGVFFVRHHVGGVPGAGKAAGGVGWHSDLEGTAQVSAAREGHFRGDGAGVSVVGSALVAAVRDHGETARVGPGVAAHFDRVRIFGSANDPLGRVNLRSGLLKIVLE